MPHRGQVVKVFDRRLGLGFDSLYGYSHRGVPCRDLAEITCCKFILIFKMNSFSPDTSVVIATILPQVFSLPQI